MEFVFIWFAIGISNYLVYEMKKCTIESANKDGTIDELVSVLGQGWVVPFMVITMIAYFIVIVPLWPWSVYKRLIK